MNVYIYANMHFVFNIHTHDQHSMTSDAMTSDAHLQVSSILY